MLLLATEPAFLLRTYLKPHEWAFKGRTDFCETLISVSKMRLSGKTLVSFSISTLNVFGKTLTLILNSQKLSNSHSQLSTFNSRYFEKINIHSKKPRWSCTKYAFFCKAFKIIPSKIVATY